MLTTIQKMSSHFIRARFGRKETISSFRLCSSSSSSSSSPSILDYRFIYPEFLPNPNMSRRHWLREKLERGDMLKRRSVIDIPEFYIGSIMAVTVSDPHAPGKKSRFVGICTQRGEHGLRSFFVLRNVIDGQGVEITYHMYNPTIRSIEVLKLEKRLDESLLYLRDAYPEYSTIPFDFEAIPHPEGAPVPVNPITVKLKPKPWFQRWERHNLKGIQPLDLPQKDFDRAKELATPWEKFDLMKEYRSLITEEDQRTVYSEVHEARHLMEKSAAVKRKRTFVRPKKTV